MPVYECTLEEYMSDSCINESLKVVHAKYGSEIALDKVCQIFSDNMETRIKANKETMSMEVDFVFTASKEELARLIKNLALN